MWVIKQAVMLVWAFYKCRNRYHSNIDFINMFIQLIFYINF